MMSWLPNAWYESAARRELSLLAQRLGLTTPQVQEGPRPAASAPAGWTPEGWAPALLATVDQHAAAVRDILLLSNGRLGPVELVGYARGIQDVAAEEGWSPTPHSADAGWAANWVNVRLAAVCLLAAAGTVAVAMSGGEADPSVFF